MASHVPLLTDDINLADDSAMAPASSHVPGAEDGIASSANDTTALLRAHAKFVQARQEFSDLLGAHEKPLPRTTETKERKKRKARADDAATEETAHEQQQEASDDEATVKQLQKKSRASDAAAIASHDLSRLFNPMLHQLTDAKLTAIENRALADLQHFLAKAILYGPPLLRREMPLEETLNIQRVLQAQLPNRILARSDMRESGLLDHVRKAIAAVYQSCSLAEMDRTRAALAAVMTMLITSGSERCLASVVHSLGHIQDASDLQYDPFYRFFANNRVCLVVALDKALEMDWFVSSRLRAFVSNVLAFDPLQVFVQTLQAYRCTAHGGELPVAREDTWRLAPLLAILTKKLSQSYAWVGLKTDQGTYVCAWVELLQLTCRTVQQQALTPYLIQMSTSLAKFASATTMLPSKEDLKQLLPLLVQLKDGLNREHQSSAGTETTDERVKLRRALVHQQSILAQALIDCLSASGQVPPDFQAWFAFSEGMAGARAVGKFNTVAASVLGKLQKRFQDMENTEQESSMALSLPAPSSTESNCTDAILSLWEAMRLVESDSSKDDATWVGMPPPTAETSASSSSIPVEAMDIEAVTIAPVTPSSAVSFSERNATLLSSAMRSNASVNRDWQLCTEMGEAVFGLLEHLRTSTEPSSGPASSAAADLVADGAMFDALDAVVRHVQAWLGRSGEELTGLLRFARVTPEAFLAPLNGRGRLLFLRSLTQLQPIWKAGKLFVLAGTHRILRIFTRRHPAHPRVAAARSLWDAIVRTHSLLVNVLITDEICGCAREHKKPKPRLQRRSQVPTDRPSSTSSFFDCFATSPSADLLPALKRLQLVAPALIETVLWSEISHGFPSNNDPITSVLELVFQRRGHNALPNESPLNIALDRTQLLESMLNNLDGSIKRQLLVLSPSSAVVGPRRLQCSFVEEGVGTPGFQVGVHREGVRLGAIALYEEAVAKGWLVPTAQPGVLWTRDCAMPPVDSVERTRAPLIMGLLAMFQVECLRQSIVLPMILSPAAFMQPSLQQQLSDRQIDVTEAEVLERIARYDEKLASNMAPLMQCSDAELASQELDFLMVKTKTLTKRAQLVEFYADRLDASLRHAELMAYFYRGIQFTRLKSLLESNAAWLHGHDERDLEGCLLLPRDTRAVWAMLAATRDSSVVSYLGGCSRDTPVVQWFWEVVLSFDTESLRQALMVFWTSIAWSAAPIGTLKIELSTEHRSNGGLDKRFPKATTCSGLLQLPLYSSREHLERQLRIAIIPESTRGFGNL
jgi:hypothetical protein